MHEEEWLHMVIQDLPNACKCDASRPKGPSWGRRSLKVHESVSLIMEVTFEGNPSYPQIFHHHFLDRRLEVGFTKTGN